MDIKKITDCLDPAKFSCSRKTEEKKSFEQVLNNVIKANGSKSTEKATAINSLSPLSGLDTPDLRYNILEQAYTVVDLLDTYSKDLANPQKSLKNIGDVIIRMEKEVHSLKSRSDDLVEHDEKLLGFVRDIAVTANVEIFKFYRGDYV
jgi:hypothetical protein